MYQSPHKINHRKLVSRDGSDGRFGLQTNQESEQRSLPIKVFELPINNSSPQKQLLSTGGKAQFLTTGTSNNIGQLLSKPTEVPVKSYSTP